MKTLKIYILTICIAICACLGISCLQPSKTTYLLTVQDKNGYIVEELAEEYPEGEEISFKVPRFFDVEVCPYLNGILLTEKQLVEADGKQYYSFRFTMPSRNSLLKITSPHNASEEVQPGTGTIAPLGTKSERFTVGYDYGTHIEGKATMLLNDSLFFFDVQDYADIQLPLLAGDELTVYYTGEMYVQETYPSHVILDGKICWIKKTKKAYFTAISSDNFVDGKLTADSGFSFVDLPEYAIARDGSLLPLSEIPANTHLLISYEVTSCEAVEGDEDVNVDILQTEMKALAIYAYDPHYPLSADEVTPWANELSASEITKIEQKTVNGSLGPNGFIQIQTTTDEGEIAAFLSYLQGTFYFDGANQDEPIDGGTSVTYTLFVGEKCYEYKVYGGHYHDESGWYHAESSPPIFLTGQTLFQFVPFDKICQFFVNGQLFDSYSNPLGNYLFQRVERELPFPDTKYVLEADGHRLILFDERHFILENGSSDPMYEIVGDVDFTEFIEAYRQSKTE